MEKKKGFTLIELLAVIVILAIIALIITPVISGVIKKAKESSDIRSAEGYVKAGENFYYSTLVDENKKNMLGSNVIDNLELSSKNATGSLIVNRDGSIDMAIIIGDKCYKKTSAQQIQDIVVSDKNDCSLGKTISNIVTIFPNIELGVDGCKTDNNNYSYLGGCYLKGDVNNNYLWYSGFLWRIMGVNSDGSIRLISEENEGITSYGTSVIYDGSYIEDWLNTYFYNKLKGTNIISDGQWCSRTSEDYAANSSVVRTTCSNIITNKVGLISLDEFNLAGGNTSYLVNSQQTWTSTPSNATVVYCINGSSSLGYYIDKNTSGIRPIINISSNSLITFGNGLLSDNWNSDHSPYIIGSNIDTKISGELSTYATTGEYVKLNNKTYRVLGIDKSGNTKLILDDFYKELDTNTNELQVYKMAVGSTIFDKTKNIGLKLNTDVLEYLIPSSDNANRNKLVNDYTWYQNLTVTTDNYNVSLNETTPTRIINATVGLVRLSEVLGAQSWSILTKNGTEKSAYANGAQFWTITPYADTGTYSTAVWNIDWGYAFAAQTSNDGALRPVIVIKKDVVVTDGNGIPSSPYVI